MSEPTCRGRGRARPACACALALAAALAVVNSRAAADDERVDFTAPGHVTEVPSGQVVAPAPEPPIERRFQGQRNLGLVAIAGATGLGLGLRAGAQRFGIEASAAWLPLVETYAANPGDVAFKFFSTWQLNGTGYFSFYRSQPQLDLGVAALYQYNSILHHGAGLAFYAQYDLSQRWAIHLIVGVVVFPKAEHLLRATDRFPEGGSISSGISSVHLGAAVSVGFFP